MKIERIQLKPLKISRQTANKLNKLDTFLARDATDDAHLAFLSKIFVIANLPHRDPVDERHWIKKNGSVVLRLSAGERYMGDTLVNLGLPFGSYARLILVWISTQALLQKTRHIRLKQSLSAFMRDLGLRPTGGATGTITSFKEQFMRLCACKITIESRDPGDDLVGTQFFIVEDKFVKWIKDARGADITSYENDIILSEKFYEIITKSSVPFEFQVISALKQSPLALDCYFWLTYRSYTLKKPTVVSWEQLMLQMGSQYNKADNFRTKFLNVKRQIELIYPALRTETVRGGLKIHPAKAHVAGALQ